MFTLAIVGRPNVGKSTLFNLIAGKKLAIVDDRPGVTRDWRDATGELMGYPLRIIDTAGLEESFDDSIQGRMRKQTELGIKQADAVLFLIDGRAGLTPLDEHFASWLRKQRIPVIVGVNKCESEKATIAAVAEAHGLGFGEPVPLAAAHGQGLDLLLDALKPHLPDEADLETEEEEDEFFSEDYFDVIEGKEDYDFAAEQGEEEDEEEKPIKLAIVGRPNVGKSTLLNALIGENRVMTGPEAGTTRDAIAVQWEFNGRKIRLVDTAGLRRKARIEDPIEKMATQDTLRAIRLAQVVILVIDGNLGMEKQDLTIAQHVLDDGRALIIAINKWDSVPEKNKKLQEIEDRLTASLAQVRGLPTLTISALHGKNLDPLMSAVLGIYRLWSGRAPTARMNRWLADMESQNPPPASEGRANRLKYITQIKTRPPTFAVWTSRPSDLPDTYKRYLINGLREDFDMVGIPVRVVVRASKNPYADKD